MNDWDLLLNKYKNSIFEYKKNYFKNKENIEIINEKLNKIELYHHVLLNVIYVIYDNLKNNKVLEYINKLFKFTLYTRDKYYGLGDFNIFKIQIYNYVLFIEKDFIHIRNLELLLESLVKRRENEENIGCWRDIRLLMEYLFIEKNISKQTNILPLFCNIYVKQIKSDLIQYNKNEEISWCAKWLPREKSRFRWIAMYIIKELFNVYTYDNNVMNNYFKQYRQIVSKLNKKLETPEINICNQEWDKINFENKSKDFYKKYHTLFLNNENNNENKKVFSEKYNKHCKKIRNKILFKDRYINKYKFENYDEMRLLDILNMINDKYDNFFNIKF